MADAGVLYEARRILEDRFRTGAHDRTADQVRKAAISLISRARHPSRVHTEGWKEAAGQ